MKAIVKYKIMDDIYTTKIDNVTCFRNCNENATTIGHIDEDGIYREFVLENRIIIRIEFYYF